jgi:hypothetical protein
MQRTSARNIMLAVLGLIMLSATACTTYDDDYRRDSYRYDRYGRYDRYDRDDRDAYRRDRFGRYDRDDYWRDRYRRDRRDDYWRDRYSRYDRQRERDSYDD